jgi:hypothetical protein
LPKTNDGNKYILVILDILDILWIFWYNSMIQEESLPLNSRFLVDHFTHSLYKAHMNQNNHIVVLVWLIFSY